MKREDISMRSSSMGVAIAALINLLGMPFEIAIGRQVAVIPWWPALVSMAVGFSVLVLLYLFRRRFTSFGLSALYLCNSFAVVGALHIRTPYYWTVHSVGVPFQAGKLGCMIVALTAPNFFTGLVAIAAHVGSSIFGWLDLPIEVSHLMLGEPLPILAFAMAGALTLYFRIRRMKVEQKLFQMQAEAQAHKETAHTFLHLRDLMNTPLQTLELSFSIMSNAESSQSEISQKVRRAIQELRELNGILTRYEEHIDWKSNGRLREF